MLAIPADFAPGQSVRFKLAPQIQAYVETVTYTDTGSLHYLVSWWDDRQRHSLSSVSQGELELIPKDDA